MKTRLSIDVNSEELTEQVKEFLETKLYHIAKGNVDTLIDNKYKGIIEGKIDDIIDKRILKGDPDAVVNAFNKKVEKIASDCLYDKYYGRITDATKQVIAETVTKFLEQEDFKKYIDKCIDDYIRSETYKALKDKIDKMMNA